MILMNPEETWWTSIPGPADFIAHVVSALQLGNAVVLQIPASFPWREKFRSIVEIELKQGLDLQFIYIDGDDQLEETPSEYIFSRYLCNNDRLNHRVGTVQDYLLNRNLLKDRVFWIKGISLRQREEWLEFIAGFRRHVVSEGVFIIDSYHDNSVIKQKQALQCFSFESFVTAYDVRLFNGLMLSAQDNQLSVVWKSYLTEVLSEICGKDVETARAICGSLLSVLAGKKKTCNALTVRELFMDCILSNSALKKRSEDPRLAASHPFAVVRGSASCQEFERNIWSAQLKVLFPLIEQERIKWIRERRKEIECALKAFQIQQYNAIVTEPEDLDWGTILRMTKNTDSNCLPLKSEKERSALSLLHRMRNALAHGNCCSGEDVRVFLNQNQCE